MVVHGWSKYQRMSSQHPNRHPADRIPTDNIPADKIPVPNKTQRDQSNRYNPTCRPDKVNRWNPTCRPDKVNRWNPNRKYQQTKSNIQALVYNLITRKSILQVKLITFYSRLWVWSHPLNGHILFNGPSYPRTESFLLR